jgi:hypothetical protein
MKTAPAKRARPRADLQLNIAGATLPPARACSWQAGIVRGNLGRGGSCAYLCICQNPSRDAYAPVDMVEDQPQGLSAAMSRRLGRGETSLLLSCSAALIGSDIDQRDDGESAHRSIPLAWQWASRALVGAGCCGGARKARPSTCSAPWAHQIAHPRTLCYTGCAPGEQPLAQGLICGGRRGEARTAPSRGSLSADTRREQSW